MAAASNVLITPTIIAREALMHLENSMVMGNLVHREYKAEYGIKPGALINIRKPNKFSVTNSATLSKTDLAESNISLSVDVQSHVAWGFNSAELTHTIADYSERYIKPASIALANSVDVALCALYKDVNNQRGTPGTTPATFASMGSVSERLDDEACPTPRSLVLNPAANWSMADALKGTFVQKLASDVTRKGFLGTIANLNVYMDQNIQRHLTGTFTTSATPIIDGATQSGTTLNTDGWNASSSTVKKGDIFTIADVYAVNPVSRQSTGVLRQFVVTADGTSSSGDLALSITPAMTATGDYQTIDSVPADSAVLTFIGTEATQYPVNFGFHRNAFALVMLPLAMPDGVSFKAQETYKGISIRVVKFYDGTNDEDIIRLDIFYGVKTLYPELACRLIG